MISHNRPHSLRYYLNLVLVDEEDRRYFKQQVGGRVVGLVRLPTVQFNVRFSPLRKSFWGGEMFSCFFLNKEI